MWLLFALACAGEPDDTDDTDASTCGDTETGTLHVCVFMEATSTEGIENGKVYFRLPGEETWTETRTGGDGCASVDVPAGDWEIQGEDDTGYCISPVETVTVAACETTEHRFDVINGCVDG
jgi:hypothetical protein